jgi:hypothetical protein
MYQTIIDWRTLSNQEPKGSDDGFKAVVSVLIVIGFIVVLGFVAYAAKSSGVCDSSFNNLAVPEVGAMCTGYEIGENLNP